MRSRMLVVAFGTTSVAILFALVTAPAVAAPPSLGASPSVVSPLAAPPSAAPPSARPGPAGPAEPPRAGGPADAAPGEGRVGRLRYADAVDIVADLGPGVATAVNNLTLVVGHTGGDPWVWLNDERAPLATLGRSAWPEAVNDAGLAVGSAEAPDGARRAVRWREGAIEELGGLGDEAAATAVNSDGEIAGWSVDAEGRRRAVRWRDDTPAVLPDLGDGAAAYGINDAGDVVGSVRLPGTNRHRAALWRGTELVALEQFAEWHWSEARGIGENGHIVGLLELLDGCCYDGFWLEHADATPDHLGWGYYAVPLAVDRKGRAVGYGADEGAGSHAYAYVDGRTILLRGDGWAGAAAYDLNEAGTVAGFADVREDDGEERRAVLWELPGDDEGPPPREGVAFTCDGVPAAPFADVASSIHRDAIACAHHWGIARGVSATEFRPAAPVTRAQMATFIAQGLDLLVDPVAALPEHADGGFSDVSPGNPHAANIGRLAEAGIVRGRTSTRYDPHAAVTRAQMASFLARAYEYATAHSPADEGSRFPDLAGTIHAGAINQIAELGITGGYRDGTYRPRADVRRDQMAAFLSRLVGATELRVREPER